ncbi:MAG: F0F1 ATP synthase subunit B [Veillonellaceae bacterium]|nr:F0F1 ATP synthase subunit B [Veillonellaceae bacterium]
MVEVNFTLIIQILNFLVLVAILGKFGFAPLMRVLDERKARIKADLDGAQEARQHAEELRREYEAQLQEARAKAQGIVADALKEAEQQAQAQLEAVREQIEQQKALAQRQLAEERDELVRELREDVVEMSTAIAAQLISKNLDADMNRKLINDCIDKLDKQQVGR